MEGEVVYIGTMDVNGEFLTGVFVMVDPGKLDSRYLYDNVNIEKTDTDEKI